MAKAFVVVNLVVMETKKCQKNVYILKQELKMKRIHSLW